MTVGLPLVSIITPVYNGAQFIEELILSVKNQDYPNIEHIVVDDGSNDNNATVGILKKYPHLRWWTRPNQGQYATMNDGLSAAKGELVCFVSADDVILPGAVGRAVDFLLSHPAFHGVFGRTGYMNEKKGRVMTDALFQDAPFSWVGYLAHVPHCSFYVRRDSLEQSNLYFDPSLFYVGDYEWMIRISKQPMKIAHMGNELSAVRIHSAQATQRYASSSLQELQGVYKKHRVNIVLRKSALLLHYYYFRWWQIGQIYKADGIDGLLHHMGRFLQKIMPR